MHISSEMLKYTYKRKPLQEIKEIATDFFVARGNNLQLENIRQQMATDGSGGLSTDANCESSPIRSQLATDSREQRSQLIAMTWLPHFPQLISDVFQQKNFHVHLATTFNYSISLAKLQQIQLWILLQMLDQKISTNKA